MMFHVFHKWTKWKPTLYWVYNSNGTKTPAERQLRECKICGLSEVRRIA